MSALRLGQAPLGRSGSNRHVSLLRLRSLCTGTLALGLARPPRGVRVALKSLALPVPTLAVQQHWALPVHPPWHQQHQTQQYAQQFRAEPTALRGVLLRLALTDQGDGVTTGRGRAPGRPTRTAGRPAAGGGRAAGRETGALQCQSLTAREILCTGSICSFPPSTHRVSLEDFLARIPLVHRIGRTV